MLRSTQSRPGVPRNHLLRITQASLAIAIAIGSLGTADAGKPLSLQRLGRQFGVGWGDGYHACRDGGHRPGADLAPQSYYDQFVVQKSRWAACENVYPPSTALCLDGTCDSKVASLSDCDGGCDDTSHDAAVFGGEIEFLGAPTVSAHDHSAVTSPSIAPPTLTQPSIDQSRRELPSMAPDFRPLPGELPAPPSPESVPPPEYASPPMTIEPANTDADAEAVTSPSDVDANELLLDQSSRARPRRLSVARSRPKPAPTAVQAAAPQVEHPSQKVDSAYIHLMKPAFEGPRVISNPFVTGTQPRAHVTRRHTDNVIRQPH
ncbi:MAG: hypothetical protein AAFU85_26135 [Planctomycetota bacterium]